jgi:hypothetical protein
MEHTGGRDQGHWSSSASAIGPRPAADSLVSTPTVRDQFLVEIDPSGIADGGRGLPVAGQAEPPVHRVAAPAGSARYARGVHSETAATPAQR